LAKSKKSSTSKKKPKLNSYNVLLSLAVILSTVVAVMFGYDIWRDRAYNVVQRPQSKIIVQNGHMVRVCNYTYTVENYFPFHNLNVYPTIFVRDSTGIKDRYNRPTSEELTKLEIRIDSFEWKTSYGDEELIPPLTLIKPTTFTSVKTMGLAKSTLNINWRYNYTGGRDPITLTLGYSSDPKGPQVVSDDSKMVIRVILLEFLQYSFLIISGFLFSFYAFQSGKLMNDYGVLSKFPEDYLEAWPSEMEELKKSLGNIIGFPKKVDRFRRLVFGMSIFVVKGLVNEKCKDLSESIQSVKEIAPYRRNSLSQLFTKGKKSTFDKIKDTLPELRTIGIVATALVGVGVSFSFNVAATAPFLYTVALLYFLINLGSILQFVAKSKGDTFWTILATMLAIGITLLPEIINLTRRFL
jgi:hypothetical protein